MSNLYLIIYTKRKCIHKTSVNNNNNNIITIIIIIIIIKFYDAVTTVYANEVTARNDLPDCSCIL
jgi:hypothetical protein